MGTLADHNSSQTTKLLLIGDSGMGKTGALASLVEAGYTLWILDFDAGLDVLANVLRAKNAALLSKVNYETVTDSVRNANGNMIPTATAWTRSGKVLNDWKIETLGSKDIIVIDSLTFAGKAAVRFVLNLNGKIQDFPTFNDYYTAQGLVERLCAALYSDTVKCNVIVMSHVREIGETHIELDSKGRQVTVEVEGSRRGFAETGTGKALSKQIGRFFNSILLVDIEGIGQSARRIIRTVPHGNIGLKNSAPGIVRATYPIATGLAEYFAAVRGESYQPKP